MIGMECPVRFTPNRQRWLFCQLRLRFCVRLFELMRSRGEALGPTNAPCGMLWRWEGRAVGAQPRVGK